MEDKWRLLKGIFASQGINVVCNTHDFERGQEIDLGFRQMISVEDGLLDQLQAMVPGALWLLTDIFGLHYLFFKTSDLLWSLGPFKIDFPHKAPNGDNWKNVTEIGTNIQRYYQSLPSFRSENILIDQFEAVMQYLYPDLTIQYAEIVHDQGFSQVKHLQGKESTSHVVAIEKRYQEEEAFLQAVEQGDIDRLLRWNWEKSGYDVRLNDRLQDSRNYLIILNTLMRKAVERAKVPPADIDTTSNYFYRKITSLTSLLDLSSLRAEMIYRYGGLSKYHSLKGYSDVIVQALSYIHVHLTSVSSLQEVAGAISINPSYLSSRFKKEVGETLTDYVQKKRIERAKDELVYTNLPIQVISEHVGFQDSNYFYKVFKKFEGQSPSEYRKTCK